MICFSVVFFFFFKQKTAYEMRISDWSSDVCSSDLLSRAQGPRYRDGSARTSLPPPSAIAAATQGAPLPMRNQSLPHASLLNTGLSGLTVLIWGTTWIALTYQVGLVAPALSVAYRFAIAAAVVFLWALLALPPPPFPWPPH